MMNSGEESPDVHINVTPAHPASQRPTTAAATTTTTTTSLAVPAENPIRKWSFVNLRQFDAAKDTYIRDLNLPVMMIAAIVNILFGGGMICLEVAAMIVAKVNHYDGMFAETAPGAWLGCFFLFVAGMGLAIRRRAQRKVTIPRSLLTLYIFTTIIVACIALAMISYITDVMITDRSQYRLCFGSSCLFDLRVFAPPETVKKSLRFRTATAGGPTVVAEICRGCNDTVIHDVLIIMLFFMIFAYFFIFVFAFAVVKITVRWTEFFTLYVGPGLRNLCCCEGRRRQRSGEQAVTVSEPAVNFHKDQRF